MDSSALRTRRQGLVAASVAVAIAAAVLGVRAAGGFERFELTVYDSFVQRLPRPSEPASRLVVVEVSEQDIQALGTYPIPDGELARVIRTLQESGAAAIGMDIYRDIPVPPGSEALEAVLTGSHDVFVPSKFADAGEGESVRPPAYLAGSEQVGFNNMIKDRDGSVRRGLLFMEDDSGATGVSLSLRLALQFLAARGVFMGPDPDDPAIIRLGDFSMPPLRSTFGGYGAADVGGYQYALDYRGAPGSIPSLEFSALRAGRFDPAAVEDRIAIIGLAAESLVDRFQIPLVVEGRSDVEIPGALLHGLMADQLVRVALGEIRPLRSPADWQEVAMVISCAVLAAISMLWVRAGRHLALIGMGGLTLLWCAGWLSLRGGYWLPILPPSVAWIGSLTAVAAYARSRESADRAEIMQLFARHVNKQVADQIWNNRDAFVEGGRPRPVRLTATILFIDVRGYTENVQKMDPAELMGWIDEFLGAMAEEVLERDGMVEDYFGDGLMACYGIPVPAESEEAIDEDARNAVATALGMERRLAGLNTEWRRKGRPPVGIRVGISTGQLVAGSMGSADRLKYGVVGDAVVTAQRLESLGDNRVSHDFESSPARILISEETRSRLDVSFDTKPVGDFLVKGKSVPVSVHQVVGRSAPEVGRRPLDFGGASS